MSVPAALARISAVTLDVLGTLAVAGHGEPSELARSAKARNRAFGSYIDWHKQALIAFGLPPEDPEAVILHLRMPRCGLPDELPARASQCRWRHEPVTTALGQGWESQRLFTAEQIRAAIEWSNARWCAVGGSVWRWAEPGQPVNQYVHHVRIDGPQNVLADQVLPCNVRPDTECRMRLDSAEFQRGGLYERFGYEYFRAVVTHEDGHKWGHEHSRDPAALMYPSARPEVLDLGADDAPRHLATYGPPKQATPPTPQPPEPPTPRPPSPDGIGTYILDGTFHGLIRKIGP